MRRLPGAAVAVLAVLCGFSAAPYTHAHHGIDAAHDEHHPRGGALVHTHASPHAHHDSGPTDPRPAHDDERGDGMWSVDGFVFQPPAPHHASSPVLPAAGEPHVLLPLLPLDVHQPRATAHGPPTGPPSGLRAPPVRLPAFA